ncbi:immunoglobulin lambda-1 light chain-like [Megalobrama amblycephala]|uniref:immunoglobulin lambda-1 light chain-like n=1 Tax=Megalobrama amblycephala TaxID=75352 RepID=UPI0020144097|nr:immunoglobulin lambda-1 light chain-like [Megalobrama amblycephala]
MLINLCAVVLIMIHGVEGLSLNQPQKVLIKVKGKTVSFRCEVTGLSSGGYVHWYQKKVGETFKRKLYISHSGVATSEAKEYASEKTGNSYGIKLKEIKEDHAGTYYCACWDGSHMGNWIKRFGTGTRLIVTEPKGDTVIAPKVSAYLPSRKTSGKQAMLCQAREMFPDLVTFTWKKKSNTGAWTDVSKADVVEQSNVNSQNTRVTSVTSMMIVDGSTAGENLYKCIVNHEGGKAHDIELKKDNKESANKPNEPDPTCPPNTDDTAETFKNQISGNSEQMPSLYLFVYAYGVMLMKNGLYFCAISIFLLKRKFGKKE